MNRGYKKIYVGTLTKELENAIEIFMNHINTESGTAEDCYRSEIYLWLKDAKDKITEEQYGIVKEYYVLGGIYASKGSPREYDAYH
jgi:hypothetical protein